MIIRPESSLDREAIWTLNVASFPSDGEARLVDSLRENANPFISLVAEQDGEVAGHILFTPVTLEGYPSLRIAGLAPMSVRAELQKKGIGSALIKAGLQACCELGFGAVVVLGHASYYPRFGFVAASQFGLSCEYDVADENFMVKELTPDYLTDLHGTIQYHPVFAAL